jgi:hypothetical protein
MISSVGRIIPNAPGLIAPRSERRVRDNAPYPVGFSLGATATPPWSQHFPGSSVARRLESSMISRCSSCDLFANNAQIRAVYGKPSFVLLSWILAGSLLKVAGPFAA